MKPFFASSLAIVLAAGPIVAAGPQDAAPAGPSTLARLSDHVILNI